MHSVTHSAECWRNKFLLIDVTLHLSASEVPLKLYVKQGIARDYSEMLATIFASTSASASRLLASASVSASIVTMASAFKVLVSASKSVSYSYKITLFWGQGLKEHRRAFVCPLFFTVNVYDFCEFVIKFDVSHLKLKYNAIIAVHNLSLCHLVR